MTVDAPATKPPHSTSDTLSLHIRKVGIAALIAYGPMLLIHALCITGFVGWGIQGVELFILVPLAALIVTVALLPFLASSRSRQGAVSTLVVSGCLVLLFIPALLGANGLRTFGFYLAARRAAPLISAIENYIRDTGTPPETLPQLVPRYLPSLPARLPALELVTGQEARERYEGNDWVLSSDVPTGLINWDQFMYFPNQRYPETGYGGWIQRIERWAYVHE